MQEEAAANAASRVCHEKPYEYKKNHKERATFNWTGLHHSRSGQGKGLPPPPPPPPQTGETYSVTETSETLSMPTPGCAQCTEALGTPRCALRHWANPESGILKLLQGLSLMGKVQMVGDRLIICERVQRASDLVVSTG